MRLRLKIFSGFLILALMLLIAGIWSIYQLKDMGSSVQTVLDENYKSITAAKIMSDALEREDSGILLLILGKWSEGREIITSADNLFENGLETAANNVTIPGEQSYIDSIRTKYQMYKRIWERPIVETQKQGNINWYFGTAHKSFRDVKSSIVALMSYNDQFMFETASNLQNEANRAIMPGIIAFLSALIFTFLFNFFVNYYFVSPIIRITKSIKRFSENNEHFDVHIESKDEIYELAKSINNLCIATTAQENKE